MGPRVLVLDNYDSFVYNLVQELGELGAEPVVFRNDAIDVAGIRAERPDAVLISPGPGRPEDGGVSLEVVHRLAGEIPLLGVCLGHQCIGQAYGGEIVGAPHLMHGKTSEIHHDGKGVFAGLPNPFVATRYHSLVVRPESVPAELEVTRHLDRRRGHGATPPFAARRGGAVPPGVGSDRVGSRRCWPTSSDSWPPAGRAERPYWASREASSLTSWTRASSSWSSSSTWSSCGWHTEMFTVLPFGTCALAAGFWVSTFPAVAPPAHVVSKVVLATRPTPVMAVWAAVCDWPTTLGTATQLPLEMTRLTDVLGGMVAPAAGSCADTTPDEN